MKTKNVKVKPKDLKQGVTIYTAHPLYGIEHRVVMSKPYIRNGIGLCCNSITFIGDRTYDDHFFLEDCGIYDLSITDDCDSYNSRRTFFKLKHAEEWVRKWSESEVFKTKQQRHEELTSDDWEYGYDY